jgi:hypothetical protein
MIERERGSPFPAWESASPAAAAAPGRFCGFTIRRRSRTGFAPVLRTGFSASPCRWEKDMLAAVLHPEGQSVGGGNPQQPGATKNCGNSHRNCRSRFSASKTTAIRTCRSRCGSHRLSSSPDLRIYGTVRPSQVSPMTGFRLAQPSTHTVAVPFVICTRFSILPWGCYHTLRHSNGYSLANRIALRPRFVNRKRDCDY